MKQNSAFNLLWAIGGTAAWMVNNAEVGNAKLAEQQPADKKVRKIRYGDGLRVYFQTQRKQKYALLRGEHEAA